MTPIGPTDVLAPRWAGRSGRLEVWYATVTDDATGAGLWVHQELVAPSDDERPPYVHGWVALFPVEGSPPVLERWGPEPADGGGDPGWLSSGGVKGDAGTLASDLAWSGPVDPLFTFPRWSWERDVLPGSQIVPVPSARFTGTVRHGASTLDIAGPGAIARIYGHGNAQRWGWLHADLGGGDVLEIVAGVSRRPGLSKLPPLPLVQLRLGGRDWPRRSLAAAPLFRAGLGLPRFTVHGTIGRRRLRVEVDLPVERRIAVGYEDPDGATATCTNSEQADAEIVLERWAGGWQTERSWSLVGTAHAEIGTRP